MGHLPPKANPQAGFALFLAVLLLGIFSMLIATASMHTVQRQKLDGILITKQRLYNISQAIHKFIYLQHRLPCPASLVLTQQQTDYGLESYDDVQDICTASSYQLPDGETIFYGMVPITSLGLPTHMGSDHWQNKLIYVISSNYTGRLLMFNQTISPETLPTSGLRILRHNGETLSQAPAYLIISPGINSFGAHKASTTRQRQTNILPSYYTTRLAETSNTLFPNADRHLYPTIGQAFYLNGNSNFDDLLQYESLQDMLGPYWW